MREGVTLVVDDGRRLEKVAERQSGEKTAANEVSGQGALPPRSPDTPQIRLPGSPPVEADAIGRYARAFAAVEDASRQREWPERDDVRAMHAGADRLDQLQPSGAEDLRTVLDRTPELAREIAAGRVDQTWRAWADEGRARASSGPDYADRFVADWRAASGERAAATGEDATWRAERKLERLIERMDEQPALERALDRQIPERQLEIDRSGITRAREMGMGL